MSEQEPTTQMLRVPFINRAEHTILTFKSGALPEAARRPHISPENAAKLYIREHLGYAAAKSLGPVDWGADHGFALGVGDQPFAIPNDHRFLLEIQDIDEYLERAATTGDPVNAAFVHEALAHSRRLR